MATILLIDDDAELRHFLGESLTRHGHMIESLDSAHCATELLSRGDFDVVLLDNRMPGLSGIEFLAALEGLQISVPVILMTGDPTSDTAIQAMNLGAFDYVVKPLDVDALVDDLEPLIAKAECIVRTTKEHVRLPCDTSPGDGPQLLGNCRSMQDVYKLIGKVAGSEVGVMILGETGTGKELVARAIHSNSPRRHRPLVAMNCTALNDNLLDDELFGHEPRSFSGAGEKLRKGLFEHAHGGSFFLDEIGDMPANLQAKLLRVLETSEVVRIGGNDPIKVDVRIISATHRDLEAGVNTGQFRQDLLFRLNGVTIHLPPLRERTTEDLRLLVEHFLRQSAERCGRPALALSDAVWEKLRDHSWPGNIRELQHVVRRAVLVSRGTHISIADIELSTPPTGTSVGSPTASEHIAMAVKAALASGDGGLYQPLHDMLDLELLRLVLAECHGNQVQSARRLGISRNGLRAKMQALGLD